MLEHIADFTAWPILTGIFIGYIANRIMSGEGKGCCMNFVIGIVGSYVGTFISHLLNIELLGKGYLTNFVFCVVGAVTLLSMITIDTINMCSHLQRKLFEKDGQYHSLWIAMQDDLELTAVVCSRQLHIYRNGKKVLILAGKSAPKIIREDPICELLQVERIKWMEQRFNYALAAIKDGTVDSQKAIKDDIAELSKYYGSELWKLDFAADEAGKLPPDLKRGVLSEDGIWNLLADYHETQKKIVKPYSQP